jgi:hypothetical protein
MFQAQEQVVEVVAQEELTEIVELSQVDLQWVGGGTGVVDTSY